MLNNAITLSLIWLAVTVVAFLIAVKIFQLTGNKVIFHPLITSVALVLVMLHLSATKVEQYQSYTGLLHWLLGPATIALAVPLYNQLSYIRTLGLKLLVPILVGGTLAPAIALLFFMFGGASDALIASILPKSITTPLAMDVASLMGGYPALAAVFVIITGVIGAVFASLVFRLASGLSDESKGVALGTVAHAIGTGQAMAMSEKAGAFSSLALCINGIITAIVLPILYFFIQ